MSYDVYWKPQPKQELALRCPATELFYGGAAGGGKSDFLLADFLQGAEKYGRHWKGILFRKTTTELEELQARAEELFIPQGAHYCGTGTKNGSNMWKFPNGATLKMRYLENEKDVQHYQGHQYTWIGIDELGNYPSPYCWTYMKSRLRSVYGVPCYIRGTANPGGVGHGWIKQRFMDGHIPNRIFYIETALSEGKVSRDTACFIPSSLDDNKILMDNDPQYEARLMSLPSHLARALRFGDWNVFEGQVLDSFRQDRHVCKPFALEQGKWFKFCSMDWGWSKPYSIGFYAVNTMGRIIRYREMYGCAPGEYNVGLKKSAKQLAEEAWSFAVTDGITDMVADPAIWTDEKIEDESKSIEQVFTETGFNMIKANNDRINGLVMVDDIFKQDITIGEKDGKPEIVPMFQVFNTCTGFIRTIPLLTPNPNHPEDIDTKLEDHAYDDHRYAVMSDFVMHPTTYMRKINGSWRQQKQTKEWEPF